MSTQEMFHIFTSEAGDIIRLTNWIFDTIQPYTKGRTLEMGSGQGAIASIFIAHGLPIHLSDESQDNREKLRKKFHGIGAVRMIHDIDFLSEIFTRKYTGSIGAFSTVVAVNIAGHGYYDAKALNNAKHLLRIRGHLIIVAPVHTTLYPGLEQDLNEYKKHNAIVVKKMMGNNVEVLKVRYFNFQADSNIGFTSQTGLSTLAILRKTSD